MACLLFYVSYCISLIWFLYSSTILENMEYIPYKFFIFIAEVLLTKITPLKEKVEVIEGDAMEE